MIKEIGKYNVELYPADIRDKKTDITYGLMIISVFTNTNPVRELGRKQFYYHDPMRMSTTWLNNLTELKVKEIYAKPQNTKFYFEVIARTGVMK